jgi:hypothetical protein
VAWPWRLTPAVARGRSIRTEQPDQVLASGATQAGPEFRLGSGLLPDRNPSWITAAHPQEVRDEQAAAELAALGFEFGGKQFVEQVVAGNQRAVELFLQAGIHPDTRSLGGVTALMAAVDGGHRELAKLLVDSGADVTLRDYRSTEMTALPKRRVAAMRNAAYLLTMALTNYRDVRLETALFSGLTNEELVRSHAAPLSTSRRRPTTPPTTARTSPLPPRCWLRWRRRRSVDSSGSPAGCRQIRQV